MMSLAVALATWLVGHGGLALWDSRTVARPPLPADYDHDLGLLAVALVVLALGPVLGMVFGALGMRVPTRAAAITGVLLSFWAWGSLLITTLAFRAGFPRWFGAGVAPVGVLLAASCGLWFGRRRSR